MHPVYTVSKPPSKGLSARGAACLNSIRTYLRGIVGQRCNLFIWFSNLPPGDCWPEVQSVYMVFELDSRVLLARGAACLYSFRTYLHGIVGQRCNMFIWFPNLPLGDCKVSEPSSMGLLARSLFSLFTWFPNLPPGIVDQKCSLLILLQNLPPGILDQRCSLLVQHNMCLQNLPPGIAGQRCSLFIQFPNLPPGDCLP